MVLKVYLSGKISGTNDYEERFADAEKYVKQIAKDYAKLLKEQHRPAVRIKVINPVKVGHKTERKRKGKPSWQDYMRDCVIALADCDIIYMLKGWEKSAGAKVENRLAKELCLLEYEDERNFV